MADTDMIEDRIETLEARVVELKDERDAARRGREAAKIERNEFQGEAVRAESRVVELEGGRRDLKAALLGARNLASNLRGRMAELENTIKGLEAEVISYHPQCGKCVVHSSWGPIVRRIDPECMVHHEDPEDYRSV